MRKILKKILPPFVIAAAVYFYNFRIKIRWLNILVDFVSDYLTYLRYSASVGNLKTKKHFESFLIKEYHAIEKALAFSRPRPGFGINRISFMLDIMERYISIYGKTLIVDTCIDTLHAYMQFNKQFNVPQNFTLARIEKIVSLSSSLGLGGVEQVKKSDLIQYNKADYANFVKTRHSVRSFDTQNVDSSVIKEAIDIARFTPSACNRQAWHVYSVSKNNPSLFNAVLDCQNGNSGFRDEINLVLIVTGCIESFFEYERHQTYIDGGMFSMNLIFSLHAKGLGTCCLNTSFTQKQDRKFRKSFPIAPSEMPIMLIAVGHLKDSFEVAKSTRKFLSEVFTEL